MLDGFSGQEDSKPVDIQSGTDQNNGQTPSQPRQATAESDFPPAPNDESKPYNPGRDCLDYIKFAVEVLGLIFLIMYTIYAGLQWREMRKATKAAKESADVASAEIRPWIKIVNVTARKGSGGIKALSFHWPTDAPKLPGFPLPGSPILPNLQIKISLENVGHSIAQHMDTFSELYVSEFKSDKWHDKVLKEEQRYCGSVKHKSPSNVGAILFPGDPWTQYMGVSGKAPKIGYAAALIACVNYRGQFPTVYQTQAWFGLYENNSIFISPNVDVGATALRLIREPDGDHAY